MPFAAAARRAGTDKVSPNRMGHHYDRLYQPWLAPLRSRPVQLLEIGLGCAGAGAGGIGGTPGMSIELWQSFFKDPSAHMTVLEIGANCTREWRQRNPNRRGVNLVTGDQTDVTLLARLAHEEAPWDVVIDDGSHINKLTLPTFYTTFPYVARGGLYFIEDMQTSWKYMDSKPLNTPGTTIHLIKSLLPILQCDADATTAWACMDLATIECRLEHCVIAKRAGGEVAVRETGRQAGRETRSPSHALGRHGGSVTSRPNHPTTRLRVQSLFEPPTTRLVESQVRRQPTTRPTARPTPRPTTGHTRGVESQASRQPVKPAGSSLSSWFFQRP